MRWALKDFTPRRCVVQSDKSEISAFGEAGDWLHDDLISGAHLPSLGSGKVIQVRNRGDRAFSALCEGHRGINVSWDTTTASVG